MAAHEFRKARDARSGRRAPEVRADRRQRLGESGAAACIRKSGYRFSARGSPARLGRRLPGALWGVGSRQPGDVDYPLALPGQARCVLTQTLRAARLEAGRPCFQLPEFLGVTVSAARETHVGGRKPGDASQRCAAVSVCGSGPWGFAVRRARSQRSIRIMPRPRRCR